MSPPGPGGATAPHEVALTVSAPGEVGPLYRRLRGLPDLTVVRQRARPAAGELGVAEVLQLLVPSSAVLAVAIRTLPAFIRSRRSSVTVTMTRGDETVTVTGTNLHDPAQALEFANRLLPRD
ncbi:hypothetical protein JGS22_001825 [Streptomyces sp. P38-E01]|uniref:Uncharacterized protein n=1 Tax=Streptomyces tardus TaxID=2780544 RepID=A0A949JLL7_9ACTN|nr:hypothetical protein [Streptomyces tardus]